MRGKKKKIFRSEIKISTRIAEKNVRYKRCEEEKPRRCASACESNACPCNALPQQRTSVKAHRSKDKKNKIFSQISFF
jgi:hypothetical protein